MLERCPKCFSRRMKEILKRERGSRGYVIVLNKCMTCKRVRVER